MNTIRSRQSIRIVASFGVCALIVLTMIYYDRFAFLDNTQILRRIMDDSRLFSANRTHWSNKKMNASACKENYIVQNSQTVENNHTVNNNTRGALLWAHFSGGLTNQRIRMKNSFYLTLQLNRQVIIVPWFLSRSKFIGEWARVSWKEISITQIYDIDYMILCLAKLNIRALYPCDPKSCVPGFSAPKLDQQQMASGQNASLPFVIGNFDPVFMGLGYSKNILQHRIDACITWSSNIERLGNLMLKEIMNISKNSDFSNVFGLHLRVEDDSPVYIAQIRGQYKPDQKLLESITTEIIDGALHCFDAHLSHVNFSQAFVYLATGERRNSTKLKKILNHFPSVITKENLTSIDHDMGEDFVATVESYLLEQFGFFIGFSESTFATQVAENRRLKYLTSAIYYLRASDRCPKFIQWNKW